jgi:ADP-ribose pyrophosphatase
VSEDAATNKAGQKLEAWHTRDRRQVLDLGKFLRVEVHTVELPDGRVIDDWPWVTTPDYINVIAVTDEGTYLFFRQTKYALEGTTLAPVGGFLEPGEEPLVAARRELREETGYEADSWQPLGSYWVDPNRGIATGSFYLARGARQVAVPCSDDLEDQVLVHLTRSEVIAALAAGEIEALSWATNVALALLVEEGILPDQAATGEGAGP